MAIRPQLRVLLFLPSVETGGVERNAILVANYLVGRDIDVELVYTRAVDYMLTRFDDRVVHRQLSRGKRVPLVHQRVSDAILMFTGFNSLLRKRKKESAVVVLSFQSNIVSIIASLVSGVPVVARVSNHPSHAVYATGLIQKFSEKLKRIFYRYADSVVTNAEVTSQYYREILPVNIVTIYNPVDVPMVRKLATESADHPWLTEKRRKVVISVGRLAKQKNFPLLLRAFSRVVGRVDACLIIVGEGGERPKLEQLIDELGLNGRVDLPGYSENVHPYVARSDLFVLSSDFEGMPNALVEAIAVDVPVVSTDCLSGPGEILQQGEGGLLVPVGDADALCDAIVEGLLDVSGSVSRKRKAAEKLGEFEYQKIMKQYEELLKKVAYA